jgi:hypothetical protein
MRERIGIHKAISWYLHRINTKQHSRATEWKHFHHIASLVKVTRGLHNGFHNLQEWARKTDKDQVQTKRAQIVAFHIVIASVCPRGLSTGYRRENWDKSGGEKIKANDHSLSSSLSAGITRRESLPLNIPLQSDYGYKLLKTKFWFCVTLLVSPLST